jgi:hypothetical protein
MRNKDSGKGKLIEGDVKEKSWEMITDLDLEIIREPERPDRKIQEKAGKTRWKAGKGIKKASRIISSR